MPHMAVHHLTNEPETTSSEVDYQHSHFTSQS